MKNRPAPAQQSPGIRQSVGGVRGPGQFGSPSKNLPKFQNNVMDYLNNLVGQMGSGGRPGVGLPDFGPTNQRPGGQGPKKWTEDPGVQTTPDLSGGNASGLGGPQQFGVYAPGVNDDQFQKENFTRQGLKGVKQLEGIGSMGGALMGGGMTPFGSMSGGGFSGGFGGGGGIMELLMSLMGQMGNEDGGIIRGR